MFNKKKKEEAKVSLGWGSDADTQKRMKEMWPLAEDGQHEKAVFLANIPDINNEADYAINMLMAYGIPAFKQYNNEGSLGKLIIGTSAYGASVYVPASLAEDAKALLEHPAEEETTESEEE